MRSAVTGVSTVSAHTTVTVGGLPLIRNTDGTGAETTSYSYTWVGTSAQADEAWSEVLALSPDAAIVKWRSGLVVVVVGHHALGPREDLVALVVGHPDELGDHLEGHLDREVVHEVEPAHRLDLVEQPDDDGAHVGLQRTDLTGGEPAVEDRKSVV